MTRPGSVGNRIIIATEKFLQFTVRRSSARLPNTGQLLVQAFGRNGHGGPEFLGEYRDFELLDHPTKFLHGLTGFRGRRGSGLKLIPGILVWGDLTGAFLIFGWIQHGALDSRQQRLEVARNVRQAIEWNLFEKARWQQRREFAGQRLSAGWRGGSRGLSQLSQLIERPGTRGQRRDGGTEALLDLLAQD